MENNTNHTQGENENLKALEILVNELKLSNVRKYTCINECGYSQLERNIVDKITNCQSEKDKVIIDKLIEALKNITDNAYTYESGMKNIPSAFINSANELLNSLK